MHRSVLRRFALSMAALVAVLFAAYFAYWHIVAQQLRDGIEPWAEAQRAQGLDVRWDQVQITGFPGAFRFHFTGASFSAARPLPTRFTADHLETWARPWSLHRWRFLAADGARLDLNNLAAFAASRVDGGALFGGGEAAIIDAKAFAIKGYGIAQRLTVGSAAAHIEVPPHTPANHQETALTAALQVSEVTLPIVVTNFGDHIAELSFAAQLKGALPPGPLPAALAGWRDDGGTVELQSMRLHWGTLLIDANGTLALDNDLQPEGAFSAVVTGHDAVVDFAVKQGALRPESSGVVKGILGLLAMPGPNGEKAITLPVSIQDRRLSLGPATIAQVPHINWE